jgi:hypothetical protein
VVALVLLVSHGILYYAVALDPGVQQGVMLDLHQRLYPRLVLLLILLLAPLPLLEVVRVYKCDYETLPLVLFDLVRRVHEHFLMVDLREELDAGLCVQPEGLLNLSTLTSNVLT